MLAKKHQELLFFFLNWYSLWMVFDWYHGFSSNHVQMWELDHKEGWAPKTWCFETVVLEKTVLGQQGDQTSQSKEINPKYSLKGLILKLKLQYFGHLMWRADIGKDPDAGKAWGLEEKGVTEDEMVEWHHLLNEHEFEQTVGNSEGQGSLLCCSPWGCKESEQCATELHDRTMCTLGFMN